jgi:hypothetical protein
VADLVIFSTVTLFCLFIAIWKAEWSMLWGLLVIWSSFAVLLYIGLKYRVLWDADGVVVRASGGSERRIQYVAITEIKIETAGAAEGAAQSRPFRRIVVYARMRHPAEFIDISLRHFRPEDIDELLNEIRKQRHDLVVPDLPWGTWWFTRKRSDGRLSSE